jgi:putative ABC transport system ATP-binding protein
MALRAAGIAVELTDVSHRHAGELGTPPVDALSEVSLQIAPGELLAVVGPSGSGKSTLLHVMGALTVPTAGRVRIGDHDLGSMNRRALARVRAETVGFVFQAFNLLPHLTVTQNVAMPSALAKGHPGQDVAELLDLVGLADKASMRPGQLSGGEQQRVAVARALVNDPQLVLADEPTGNLDSRSGAQVVDLLLACHAAGRTVVFVTHDMRLASRAERVVHLRDGQTTDETRPSAGGRTRREGPTWKVDPSRLRVG